MQRPITERVIPRESENAPSHAEVKFGVISFAHAANVKASGIQPQPQTYLPATKRLVEDFERLFPKLTPTSSQLSVSVTKDVEVVQTVPEVIAQEPSSEEENEISTPEESKDASTEEDISVTNDPSVPSVSKETKVTKHVTFALVNEVIPMPVRSNPRKSRRSRSRKRRSSKKAVDIK